MKTRKTLFACGVFLALLFLLPTFALSQDPYYQGKTITIISAREPGGTGDLRVRAVMPFLQKYIPGSPTIALEFMPGGGGRKAANHLYRAVRPDGLTIANIGAGFVSNAVLGQPGVQYDIDKFIYLGSGNSRTSYVFMTRREAGLDTLGKLRAASGVRIGAHSVGHDIYINGRLFAWIIPVKDHRFVTGYSWPEMDLAILRGEIDSRAGITDTLAERTPEWIEKGLMHLHAILEIPKGFRHEHPVYKPLPSLESLTRTDAQRRVLAMFRNFRLIGSPFLAPPGTPKERVDILEEAFRKTFRDPEFLKEFQKLTGAEATPLMPEEQERTIKEIPREREVIDLFNKIAGAGPLPSR